MTGEQLQTSKTLNVWLWVTQGLLAVTFVWAGTMKIMLPDKLPFPWVQENPGLALGMGIIDLAAGAGIVLPLLFRARPSLTILAAYGIVALMIAACIFHVARGESKDIGFNLFMALLASFVAWGRQKKIPVHERT